MCLEVFPALASWSGTRRKAIRSRWRFSLEPAQAFALLPQCCKSKQKSAAAVTSPPPSLQGWGTSAQGLFSLHQWHSASAACFPFSHCCTGMATRASTMCLPGRPVKCVFFILAVLGPSPELNSHTASAPFAEIETLTSAWESLSRAQKVREEDEHHHSICDNL